MDRSAFIKILTEVLKYDKNINQLNQESNC